MSKLLLCSALVVVIAAAAGFAFLIPQHSAACVSPKAAEDMYLRGYIKGVKETTNLWRQS